MADAIREALRLADKAAREQALQWSPLFRDDERGQVAQHIRGNVAMIQYLKWLGEHPEINI